MIVGAVVLVEVTAGITEGVVAYPLFVENRRSGFRAFMVGPIPVSENVSVRPMGEVDIAAGRSLLGQLGCDLTLAEMGRRFIAIASSAGHAVLVAECEGRLVGLRHLYVRPALDKPPEVVVPAIVIDAGSCSRGIGKTLMSAAERWASERGYHSVALYSNVSRDGAHSFYNVLGYRLLATSHLFRRDFRN
jgi:GNAT superfamily N-acetyltransferase